MSRDENKIFSLPTGARKRYFETAQSTSNRMSLPTIPEEGQQNPDQGSQPTPSTSQSKQNSLLSSMKSNYREGKVEDEDKPSASLENVDALERLENEDVEDRFSRIKYAGMIHVEVIDEELKEYFREQQKDHNLNGMLRTTRNYSYVGKDNKLYRKPVGKYIEDEEDYGMELVKPILTNSLLDDVINSTDFSNNMNNDNMNRSAQAAKLTGTKQKVLNPPQPWKSNIYSEIMAGRNSDRYSESEDEGDNRDYTWLEEQTTKVKKEKVKKQKHTEIALQTNHLTLKELEKIEKEIPSIKIEEFSKLKDQYFTTYTTLQVSENQLSFSEPRYLIETGKKDQDRYFIKQHSLLRGPIPGFSPLVPPSFWS